MNPIILVVLFAIASLLGYKIISNVPSLLHTPLMSGSNALSGVTILGVLAVVLAMINVVGGFAVTHRMLKMFQPKKSK